MHIARSATLRPERRLLIALLASMLMHLAAVGIVIRRPMGPLAGAPLTIELLRARIEEPIETRVPTPARAPSRARERGAEPAPVPTPEPAVPRANRVLDLRIPREPIEAPATAPHRQLDALPDLPQRHRPARPADVEPEGRETAAGRALTLREGCFLLSEGQSLGDEPLWWRRPCPDAGERPWEPHDPASVHPTLRPR